MGQVTLFTFIETNLEGLWVIEPKPFKDNRGSFFRVFCKETYEEIGFEGEFVQINHSINAKKGTIRGLHFQYPPFSETKLVRCINGKVFDVVVDIRKDSPTFLKHFSIELSKDNQKSLLIPKGFAHGFQTLEDNSELIYHHTNYYTPNSEGGIRYDDPMLNIDWKLLSSSLHISERDQSYDWLDKTFKGIKIEH